VYSVNVPNEGQVTNLPRGAVIECPAMATATGLRPLQCGAMPQGMAATLASRFAWVDLTVEAALEGNRDKFVQALVVDGSVKSLAEAEELAYALLTAHAQWLPRFRRGVT
jgi:alpha-galactosidase